MSILTVSLKKKHAMSPDTTDTLNNIVLGFKEWLLLIERNNIACDLEQNILDGCKLRFL